MEWSEPQSVHSPGRYAWPGLGPQGGTGRGSDPQRPGASDWASHATRYAKVVVS